ncbi:MAG: hypothetical protein V7676_16450 [Parasphingorhabdus sp.]|uniref:hypothetical protein n=1 Tax=Parasphingorhabdus sp. TaxID=2709688 RepID=UPI003002E8F7
MNRLRTGEGYFSLQQNTWTDDYEMTGEERRMWAKMRMMPTDIADIGAPTYTFLANGRGANEGLEYLFKAGERVRLLAASDKGTSLYRSAWIGWRVS